MQSKIIILGDNHLRLCSLDVKHNLDHNMEIHGIAKPVTNAETIVNTSAKKLENLQNRMSSLCGEAHET